MGFLQHIALLSFITMVNEVPELYLKASVFTLDIFYMPKGNHVQTLSMKFYCPTHHLDI